MKRQGFIKGSAILLAMVLITKILGLLYKIPLTNLLGGTGMGYFASAFSVFTPVFAIVVSGIPSTMARLTAENYALERFQICVIPSELHFFFSRSSAQPLLQ